LSFIYHGKKDAYWPKEFVDKIKEFLIIKVKKRYPSKKELDLQTKAFLGGA